MIERNKEWVDSVYKTICKLGQKDKDSGLKSNTDQETRLFLIGELGKVLNIDLKDTKDFHCQVQSFLSANESNSIQGKITGDFPRGNHS